MSKQAAILSVVVLVGFCGWGVQVVYGEAMQSFVQVAFLPEAGGLANLAGYDTDHDGREELLAPGHPGTWLFEHTGDNQYELVLEVVDHWPWAAGDIDDDGLADIVIQNIDSLKVFESPAPDSHPSHCVWQWGVVYPGNAAKTWITDLDQDGKREMLVSHAGAWVYVFEENGDNTYVKVFEEYTCPPVCGISEMCYGDFDLDGKKEFVTSDEDGRVVAYENTTVGMDSFAISWIDSLPIANAIRVAAGNDMDQDGRPEFVVGGTRNSGGGHKIIFTLFETTGDDAYEPVWADSSLSGGLFDYHHAACGDVDGDSLDEMVLGLDGFGFQIFKCNGPDSYELIWQQYVGGYIGHILIYDLNKNGYGEIVVSAENGTYIYEKELPGIEEDERPFSLTGFRLMQNVPNPFSRETVIRYQLSTPRAVILRIYDLKGSAVRTLTEGVEESGLRTVVWDGKDDRGEQVASGLYLYRLTACPEFGRGAGDPAATRKLVVLR